MSPIRVSAILCSLGFLACTTPATSELGTSSGTGPGTSSGSSGGSSSGATPALDAGVSDANPTVDSGEASDAKPGDATSRCAPAGTQVVAFTTDDGVKLSGELHSTGKAGGPAAVLLHMIPPSNDHKNFPAAFVDKLVAKGITVLNIDRRGAGASGGVAKEAYTGPQGKLDAKAAVTFLTASTCAADANRIALVGASNGTTTALDYALSAGSAKPKALVFLTGGTYTELQNTFAKNRPALDVMPIMFVFSKAERAWSAALQPGAPAAWQFKEYDKGDHGTRMFQAQPASMDAVAEFVDAQLKP
jgi:pimeloyl-ACP methyl ester carboxylesterase